MIILVINAGSSSVKYQLFQISAGKERRLAKGIVEPVRDYYRAMKDITRRLTSGKYGAISSAGEITAIGHRVVHGGEDFKNSVLLNSSVIKRITRYNELAPLHNAPNLACIEICRRLFPETRQVAVFDTAFHHTMPERAYIYGIPYEYYKKYKIRRYGFHGTSHRYVAHEAAKILNKPLGKLRLVTCHLGNGCSITAVKNGRSVDTSMGFTPLEGLIMGTRTGDLDPAVIFFLVEKAGIKLKDLNGIFNKKSGLLGISGISNDMRKLIPLSRKGVSRARLAIEAFVYRVVKYIGAYAAAMGGLDAVVFTAGIGENQPYIRDKIKGAASALLKNFKAKAVVVKTDEELMIARQTVELICR